MTAAGTRGVPVHVAEQRPGALVPLAVTLEHLSPPDEIGGSIQEHTFGRQPITAGAAGFLLVVFRGARRARMDDEPDVRSVDAHPEGDCGDDDVDLLVEKRFLVAAPNLVRETSVVRQRAMALRLQPLRQRLNLSPRLAVDDAGLVLVPPENGGELIVQVAAAQHAVSEIRPIEGADEDERIVQPEL